MSDKSEAARRLAQMYYQSGSTTHVYEAHASVGTPEPPDDPVKLVEVNEDTVPSGIVPIRFGPIPELGTDCSSITIQVTPEEFERIQNRELPLPQGWDLDSLVLIPRLPDTVSLEQ